MAEARRFARLIEATAATICGAYSVLGDKCDFVTLAGDWPYRYLNNEEGRVANGEHALDDLVGRLLPTGQAGLEQSRSRWAFTGRLLGNPASSLYRAMCSLFLQPESALLWNTYPEGVTWSDYRMTEAARTLGLVWPRSLSTLHRSGADASLADMAPCNRSGQPVYLDHGQLVRGTPPVFDPGRNRYPGRHSSGPTDGRIDHSQLLRGRSD